MSKSKDPHSEHSQSVNLDRREGVPEKIFTDGNCFSNGQIIHDAHDPTVADYAVELGSGNIFFSGNLMTGQVGSDTQLHPKPLHVLDLKEQGLTHEQTLEDLQQALQNEHKR